MLIGYFQDKNILLISPPPLPLPSFSLFTVQVDLDGSGEIDFDEFCDLMMNLMMNSNPENEVHLGF